MPGIHTEDQLQREVAEALVAESGWTERPAADLAKTTRLIFDDLFAFLEQTQPKAVEQLKKRTNGMRLDWRDEVVKALVAELDKKPGNVLSVLRHGKKVHMVPLRFAYFRPAFGHNPDLIANYQANRLTVIREAPVRKPDGTWGELDLVLCVNGIPVADAELKNRMTGTTVDDAIAQYKGERDPHDILLRHRSVVHFAVDTDDVFMATAVHPDLRFLPFNRGSEPDGTGGQGNYDPGDETHKTSYLWRQVWQRDHWLDLLNRFVHVEEHKPKKGEQPKPPTIVFPRFHQWDCVLKLEADAREHGPGRNCLVQHSAGSGKSKTIGWTAHRLKELHRTVTDGKVSREERVFDKVVVITDRTVLDDQLTAVVKQFERKDAAGQVVHADTSKDLAEALKRPSVRIVVTTLQKFPFAKQLDVLDRTPVDGGVAVLIDEAHSSQAGDSAKHMKEVLAAGSLEEAAELEETLGTDEDDIDEAVRRSAAARKRQSNISMFAFTATPKPKTRELFGTPFTDADGQVKYRPFHLYSMRQAIEEGFILDVLRNYTSWRIYYRLATESDELVEKSSAAATAKRFPTLHPHVLEQKVAILVEHFREKVAHKIGGHAKAMVVTRSRLHAVRYKHAIDAYVAAHGYTNLHALVAFSGPVEDTEMLPGEQQTESSLNGFPMSQTAGRFKGEPSPPNDPGEYQVMVVAEKYQTGFDAPLLHTMYVDKPLKDVAAVQTLGRLNRTHPLKEDTFVLDFVNEPEDIQAAFEPYYTTAVTVATHPQTLSETWQRVEDHLIIEQADVDAFAAIWFAPPPPTKGHSGLEAALKPAEARFHALDESAQDAFRKALKQFIRLYAFLAQVLPYEDTEAEKNFAYAKMLARRIAAEGPGRRDYSDLLELTHVNARKTGETNIKLAADTHEQYAFTGTGEGPLTEQEMVHISEIVEQINQHHGAELGDEHRILRKVIEYSEVVSDHDTVQEQAVADQSDEAFALGDFRRVFEEAILEVADEDSEFHDKVLNKPELLEWMIRAAVPFVRRRATEKHSAP